MFSPRNPLASSEEPIKVQRATGALVFISALKDSGFNLVSVSEYTDNFLPCPVGTFSNSSSQGAEGCIPCPPGILKTSLWLFWYFFPGCFRVSWFLVSSRREII